MASRGKGKGINWIRAHASHKEYACLIWPYSRNRQKGYGNFGFEGEMHYAHRFMCELVHGTPPTPGHQAAHSCGNGHLGCVNPRHLFWRTNSENQYERRWHGRRNRETKNGARTKLTPQQVEFIRASKGVKTQSNVATILGVSAGCVEYWQSHDRPPIPLSNAKEAERRRAYKAKRKAEKIANGHR